MSLLVNYDLCPHFTNLVLKDGKQRNVWVSHLYWNYTAPYVIPQNVLARYKGL